MSLDWQELVGYVASALVVASLAMTSVVRLRTISLAGSVTFVVYGVLIGSVPIIITNASIGIATPTFPPDFNTYDVPCDVEFFLIPNGAYHQPDLVAGDGYTVAVDTATLPAGFGSTCQVIGPPEEVARLVGGDLRTLLYVAQLAAISQHVWPSRVGSLDELDYTTLDLDPSEGVPFSAVRDAARATK